MVFIALRVAARGWGEDLFEQDREPSGLLSGSCARGAGASQRRVVRTAKPSESDQAEQAQPAPIPIPIPVAADRGGR